MVQAGSRRFNEGSRIKGARMLFGSRMFQNFKKVQEGSRRLKKVK